jgi:hypothetical protein
MPTTGDLVHYFDRSMETPGPHEATVAPPTRTARSASRSRARPVVHSDKLGSYHL